MNTILKFLILTIAFYSLSSSAYEYGRITRMLLEFPLTNVKTVEKLGLKGRLSDFNSSGYNIEYHAGREVLYLSSKQSMKFSRTGFLEQMIKRGSLNAESNWHFEYGKLIKITENKISANKLDSSSNVINFIYNNDELEKVEGQIDNNNSDYLSNYCHNIAIKGNLIYARQCSGVQNMIYTFNDEQKIISFEQLRSNTENVYIKNHSIDYNQNIKEYYYYEGDVKSDVILFIDGEKVVHREYHYDESDISSLVVKTYENDDVISESKTNYDIYGNTTSWSIERVKPKDYNPIFGEFEPRSAKRTEHVQENDEYGNPLYRESTFYKVENNQTEILVKKEFRTFKYKYYKE